MDISVAEASVDLALRLGLQRYQKDALFRIRLTLLLV